MLLSPRCNALKRRCSFFSFDYRHQENTIRANIAKVVELNSFLFFLYFTKLDVVPIPQEGEGIKKGEYNMFMKFIS